MLRDQRQRHALVRAGGWLVAEDTAPVALKAMTSFCAQLFNFSMCAVAAAMELFVARSADKNKNL